MTNVSARDMCKYLPIKWVTNQENTLIPIIMQNEEGPCPIIALINALILQKKIELPLSPNTPEITHDLLLQIITDLIVRRSEMKDGEKLYNSCNDYRRLIEKASLYFHGMPVNPKFDSPGSFENAEDTDLFKIFQVPLYHAWIVEPCEDPRGFIKHLSYNDLTLELAACEETRMNDYVVLKSFFDKTQSQITVFGLNKLFEVVKEGEYVMFYRNNHLSTLTKHEGVLYQLVTCGGYLSELDVVWENLTILGDSEFFDINFRSRVLQTREEETSK